MASFLLQVLENNRNQLEAKGVQLAANKDQLQTISLKLEQQDSEMTSMRETIGSLEKQLASSLKDMLLQENSPRQEVRTGVTHMLTVCMAHLTVSSTSLHLILSFVSYLATQHKNLAHHHCTVHSLNEMKDQ